MKKLSVAVLTGALLAATSSSFADVAPGKGFYVQALGGVAMGNASGLNSVETGSPSITSGVETTDNDALFGGAVGYAFPNLPLRVELQALHINKQSFQASTYYTAPSENQYHEFDNLAVSSNVYLANVYYTWPLCSNFRPFIGAGAGVAQNKVSGTFFSDTQTGFAGSWKDSNHTNFAYDLTAGVGYQITPHVGVSLAYQYLSLGKATTGHTYYGNDGSSGPQTLSADKISLNNALLGVAYTF